MYLKKEVSTESLALAIHRQLIVQQIIILKIVKKRSKATEKAGNSKQTVRIKHVKNA